MTRHMIWYDDTALLQEMGLDDRNGEQELPASGRVRARIQVGGDHGGDDHYGDDHGGYNLILVANNNN